MSSAFLARERKGDIKKVEACACLVAVADPFYRKALRGILHNMQFKIIETCRDGGQAIFLIQQMNFIDLIILQEDLPIHCCAEIVQLVRNSKNWAPSDLPIISVGWKWTREKIELARQAGVTDVVVFPTSQHALQRRILSALYSERPLKGERAE